MSETNWLERLDLFTNGIQQDSICWENLTDLEEKSIRCLLAGAIADSFANQLKPTDTFDKLFQNPIKQLRNDARWNENTSITLIISLSLIEKNQLNSYDQLVKLKRWWKHGYLSSNGRPTYVSLFEFVFLYLLSHRKINVSMRQSLEKLQKHENELRRQRNLRPIDNKSCRYGSLLYFDDSPLSRVAPIVLFFYSKDVSPNEILSLVKQSVEQTHLDSRVIDCCRYLAIIFYSILEGDNKQMFLSNHFSERCYKKGWLGSSRIHYLVEKISQGSYKKADGYFQGIRSNSSDILCSLETILWCLWSDNDIFERGLIQIVQLGNHPTSIASVYGQLAALLYLPENNIPIEWIDQLYAKHFIESIGKLLVSHKHLPIIQFDESNEDKVNLWKILFPTTTTTKANQTKIDRRPFAFGAMQ